MERLCPTYHRGHWDLVELSNGGGYMAPSGSPFFDLCVEGHGFDARVSPDAAGVIATAFALSSLVWQGHKPLLQRYEQLVEFIGHRSDQAVIRHALGLETAPPAAPAPVKAADESLNAFKNFHRLLCERFDYVHDHRDWQRDQLSLIEHIAGKVASPPLLRNPER
jgi:hypothetical protein